MVIALAFFKRIFTRSLPMNQAHGLIIAEVCGTCGVNAWAGRDAGDRIINEHDESEDEDLQEELYLVQRGRATFELDGQRVDAPAGTLVFARPGVKRTAFAEEAGTTIVALGGTPG